MNTEEFGFDPHITTDGHIRITARISAVHRGHFEYMCDKGTGLARLKKSNYYAGTEAFPTVGDFVLLDWQEGSESRIVETLPRKSFFSRRDPSSVGQREQAIAANFDYVFIMQSLDGDFNIRRLERYLTQAWQSGATPVVLLTKSDLINDCSVHIAAAEQVAFGVEVLCISTAANRGLKHLDTYLQPGKTAVFLGSSGVGKSSLVNVLAGKKMMETKTTREKDGRGRHATTHRQLIALDNGAYLIDTPGMRELGMWDVSEGLGQGFSDIESYFCQCHFRDCTHHTEPGCAVKAALRSGELSSERWEHYLRLSVEARYVDDKASYLRDKARWHKEISLMNKAREKMDYRQEICTETFTCTNCGAIVFPDGAGSNHRNHCPHCLASVHADNKPGDRRSLCRGTMDAIALWSKDNGEWALIHRCRSCGSLRSNRIAADDSQDALLLLAEKPGNSLKVLPNGSKVL